MRLFMQRDDKFGKDAIIETQVILQLCGNFGYEREILELVERVIHRSVRRCALHGCHLLRHSQLPAHFIILRRVVRVSRDTHAVGRRVQCRAAPR